MSTASQVQGAPIGAPAASSTIVADTAAAWRDFGARLRVWRRRASSRRQLARMDERGLRDIGLSRADALQEARKWFWQN